MLWTPSIWLLPGLCPAWDSYSCGPSIDLPRSVLLSPSGPLAFLDPLSFLTHLAWKESRLSDGICVLWALGSQVSGSSLEHGVVETEADVQEATPSSTSATLQSLLGELLVFSKEHFVMSLES